MADRLGDIIMRVARAEDRQGKNLILEDFKWLIADCQRARKIEDVAKQVSQCLCEFPDEPGACQEWVDALYDVIERNPRPCDDK